MRSPIVALCWEYWRKSWLVCLMAAVGVGAYLSLETKGLPLDHAQPWRPMLGREFSGLSWVMVFFALLGSLDFNQSQARFARLLRLPLATRTLFGTLMGCVAAMLCLMTLIFSETVHLLKGVRPPLLDSVFVVVPLGCWMVAVCCAFPRSLALAIAGYLGGLFAIQFIKATWKMVLADFRSQDAPFISLLVLLVFWLIGFVVCWTFGRWGLARARRGDDPTLETLWRRLLRRA